MPHVDEVITGSPEAIASKAVTEDLAAQVTGSRTVGCVEFGDIIGANL